MIRLPLATLALAAPAAATMTPLPTDTALPEWLAGRWCTDEGPRGQSCEDWQRPFGGMMLGTSQTVKDGRTVSFEFLRIATDGGKMAYLPQPGGKPPVAFLRVEGGEGVTFVKPDHDYPQRIHYRRDGETLVAEISLADGSKAMRWTFRRSG